MPDDDGLNPFADENVQSFILLTLLQIRDWVAVTARANNPQGYAAVALAHKKGTLYLDPPHLAVTEKPDADTE